ncbi:hypothetical protein Tco_0705884 [Tanacetum coccineum]|uniref:Uncharacterized protein n=1 Tax=Tanacetum coccineum TaxID=301880 RepID=A0ABQ4Y7D9_9ASTR
MDDPNITMKEYIRIKEEKVLGHSRMFNWQTATYSMMECCEDEDDCFTNFKTDVRVAKTSQEVLQSPRMQYGISLGLRYGVLTTCMDLAVTKLTNW